MDDKLGLDPEEDTDIKSMIWFMPSGTTTPRPPAFSRHCGGGGCCSLPLVLPSIFTSGFGRSRRFECDMAPLDVFIYGDERRGFGCATLGLPPPTPPPPLPPPAPPDDVGGRACRCCWKGRDGGRLADDCTTPADVLGRWNCCWCLCCDWWYC